MPNPGLSMQAKFAALSTSAKQWTDQTGTTLRNAAAGHFGGSTDSPTASSTLKEIARSQSGALPASAAPESGKENQAAAKQKDAGLGHDQELEAYLHVSPPSPCLCVEEGQTPTQATHDAICLTALLTVRQTHWASSHCLHICQSERTERST